MEWKFNLRENKVLEVNAFGMFSNAGYLKMFEQVVTDPKWNTGMHMVVDFRDVAFNNLHFDDVVLSVNMHTQFDNLLGKGKIAAIHSNNKGFRLGSIYKELSNPDIKSKLEIFRDYEEGIVWVCGDNE
ncbi:MAG: hypothetical protein PVG39_19980 [Desulfobacteraceae bacterium]|jgi:hypothetical protein